MKTTEAGLSQALEEVWEWKEAVCKDTEGMPVDDTIAYFADGLETAARLLGARLERNPDGSYNIV